MRKLQTDMLPASIRLLTAQLYLDDIPLNIDLITLRKTANHITSKHIKRSAGPVIKKSCSSTMEAVKGTEEDLAC